MMEQTLKGMKISSKICLVKKFSVRNAMFNNINVSEQNTHQISQLQNLDNAFGENSEIYKTADNRKRGSVPDEEYGFALNNEVMISES